MFMNFLEIKKKIGNHFVQKPGSIMISAGWYEGEKRESDSFKGTRKGVEKVSGLEGNLKN